MPEMTIHNAVSSEQLALEPYDQVDVTRDSGFVETRIVKFSPWQLANGTWMIGIFGISGGYALCRVQPNPDTREG